MKTYKVRLVLESELEITANTKEEVIKTMKEGHISAYYQGPTIWDIRFDSADVVMGYDALMEQNGGGCQDMKTKIKETSFEDGK